MITHQILITFDSARDLREQQFANYDSTQMRWFLVRDKECWWLTAEAGGFAERISQLKVTGQQVEQFMFSVLKKRGLLDDEALVSFSDSSDGAKLTHPRRFKIDPPEAKLPLTHPRGRYQCNVDSGDYGGYSCFTQTGRFDS